MGWAIFDNMGILQKCIPDKVLEGWQYGSKCPGGAGVSRGQMPLFGRILRGILLALSALIMLY